VSLFGIGRKRDERKIFAIRLELRSGAKQLPAPMAGAIVTALSFADGPSEAAEKSFRAAVQKGVLARVLPDGFTIPVHQFRAYVEEHWLEFAEQMPPQSEIAERLEAGEIVFGPLIGFERG
jgi:hypothetical protein